MTEQSESKEPKILIATKRGKEVSKPSEKPKLPVETFYSIHEKIIDDRTSEEKRSRLQEEQKGLVRKAEELEIIRWRDIRYGVLRRLKRERWDDVYPVLMDYARNKESDMKGINIGLPDRERYHGLVQSAIEMAALDVSVQGMKRRSGDADFEDWLIQHGKTPEELAEDELTVERGKILDFQGVDLPDLVGASIKKSHEKAYERQVERSKKEEKRLKEERRKKEGAVIDRPLSEEDFEERERIERGVVTALIRNYMKPAVETVGEDNTNLLPSKNQFTVEMVVSDLDDEINDLRGEIQEKLRKGLEVPERAEIIMGRMEAIKSWFEGNGALIKAAGPMLEYFYDGLRGMASTLSTPSYLRYDVRSDELGKMYSTLSKIPDWMKGPSGEWKLGREIIDKQDQIYAILRGIAAVHRHSGRNMGRRILPQHSGKNIDKASVNFFDYPVTDKQIEFIERVFASKTKTLRTTKIDGAEQDEWIEVLELLDVIADVMTKDAAISELKDFFKNRAKEGDIRKVAVGEKHEVTKMWLKKNLKKLVGKSLWVDGVEWQVTKDNLDGMRKELEWKHGSGDMVFVGEVVEVNKNNIKDINKKRGESVAMLRKTPGAIDNLFVMGQDTRTVDETKMKLAAMLNTRFGEDSLWKRLKDENVNVDALIEEFENELRKQASQEMDLIDEHIINTARIALLYFCEGSALGWGFEYQEDKELGVYKRGVGSGGTKAATDMAVPFHWLRTEASNNWKDWTQGPMPMDKGVAKQILDHEPGWAPELNEKGVWRTYYLGKPLTLRVPRQLELSMLKSAVIRSGEHEERKALDLVYDGEKMSDIPWERLVKEAPYRWYITLNQAARIIALLSKVPDRDTTATYFGESMTSPRTVELLELMKRQALTHRDTGEMEYVKEFLPLASAVNLAWQENMLPRSLEPGMFRKTSVEGAVRNTEIALESLSPKGNREIALEMSASFSRNIEQLLEMAKKLKKKVYVERARKR